MRILVCDDQLEASRAAIDRISSASKKDGGKAVVTAGSPQTARSAFQAVASTKFDVVLIDLFLPVKIVTDEPNPASGPWLARAILRAYPALRAPLVMWTTNAESTLEHRNQSRAFRYHGGAQIIDKVGSPSAQLHTLEAALAGETWRPPADELTEGERDVLAYYAAGRSAADIAKRLSLAKKTIEGRTSLIRRNLLPYPAPPEIGNGSGAVVAAAAAPGSRVSWLPIEHLGEPPAPFDQIDKG
jgi:DNA-binding NarL/FixJ family response regulator